MNEMDAKSILELKEQNQKMAQELEEQKAAVYNLEKQLRIAPMQEKRDAMREGINDIASIILSELEYQQELIDELKTDDAEYFQPTHDTLVDLTRIIERCTADDEYADMVFNLEDDDAQSTQRHEELLSQLDEQSGRLKLQSMRLSMQKSKIDEQTSLISELEVQKRKIASDLEEANEQLTFMRETQGCTAISQVQLKCTELCDERDKSMKQEIHQLNRRLRPLETKLFNKRQVKFCDYLRASGSISAMDAKVMIYGIGRLPRIVDMAEIDARMFEDRLARLDCDYIPDFVRVYGVLPSKILNSNIIKHPFVIRVFNEVGAIHLENRELAKETQEKFNRVLRLLEEEKSWDILLLCRRMSVRARRDYSHSQRMKWEPVEYALAVGS